MAARNNPNYGGELINQKYSPLHDIILAPDDHAYYRALFTGRINALTGINAYPPNAINFYADWDTVNPAVVAAQAPMVVASTNRANWMQQALRNADAHVEFTGAFTGYLDATTFDNDVVPWYAPLRSGRPLYVVVHWSEYDYYNARIGGFANVTVVAYKFTTGPHVMDIAGFGASRYAALQLMIGLHYQKAWAVDDNTVNINGFPNALATIEAHMAGAVAPIWGIGFGGATRNIGPAGLYDGTVTFAAVPDNFALTGPGLLQQAVLWNVAQFAGANINFCPIFVSSNEDISLSNFLQRSERDERIVTAFRIVKINAAGDPPISDGPAGNLGASTLVAARRNRMQQVFSTIEQEIPINPGGGDVELYRFIRDTVLPVSNQPQDKALTAQTQAVEQVLAAATRNGWYPATAFNPYNGPPAVNYRPVAQIG
ncbi:MAG: hypothetical protein ACREHE_17595 [Rhizomicrobium sp.]